MQRHRVLRLFLVPLTIQFACATLCYIPDAPSCAPCYAQGMVEFGDVRSGSAGAGAGAAAGLGGLNQVLQRSFQGAADAQNNIVAQTKAIEQYYWAGCQYEAKKQWAYAEQSFKYVLQVIAARDGAHSPSCVPVLQHLVKTSKEQKKLDQAIGYQKSVLSFAKAEKRPDAKAVVNAQQDLSGMYVEKRDYAQAEPVLRDSAGLCDRNPSLPVDMRKAVLKQYSAVLRKLNKNSEADKADKAAFMLSQPALITPAPTTPAPTTPAATTPAATTPAATTPAATTPAATTPAATTPAATTPATTPAATTPAATPAATTPAAASTVAPETTPATTPTTIPATTAPQEHPPQSSAPVIQSGSPKGQTSSTTSSTTTQGTFKKSTSNSKQSGKQAKTKPGQKKKTQKKQAQGKQHGKQGHSKAKKK